MADFLTRGTFKDGLVSEGAATVPDAVAATDALNKRTGDAAYAALSHTHSGGGSVYFGPSTDTPNPASYSMWVVRL